MGEIRIPDVEAGETSDARLASEATADRFNWPFTWNEQQTLRRWLDAALSGVEFVNITNTIVNQNTKRYMQAVVFDFATDVTTGDGKFYMHVPSDLDSLDLVEVHAEVITAGTTGTTDIQIANVTDSVDMLSTKLTIDTGETGSDTAATVAVINTANDDVAENDVLRVDVDAVSTTAPKGLIVTLGFQKP